MARNVPPLVFWLGVASLSLGVIWLLAVLVVRGGDMGELLRAGQGDPEYVFRLTERGLSGGTLFLAIPLLILEIVVAVMLAVAGVGLLRLLPFARWTAVFACASAIAVEVLSSVVLVFCLTSRSAAVKVVPLILGGLVTLAAIVLWGSLFLPPVVTAYADGPAGTDNKG